MTRPIVVAALVADEKSGRVVLVRPLVGKPFWLLPGGAGCNLDWDDSLGNSEHARANRAIKRTLSERTGLEAAVMWMGIVVKVSAPTLYVYGGVADLSSLDGRETVHGKYVLKTFATAEEIFRLTEPPLLRLHARALSFVLRQIGSNKNPPANHLV